MAKRRAITRYDVTGPPNGCDGPCEGTGVVPVTIGGTRGRLLRVREEPDEWTEELHQRWREAEARKHSPSGTHFVPCPKCRP